MGSLKPRICVVGQLLGRNPGYVTTQGQILADSFVAEGFDVISVSSKLNRFFRLSDVVATIISERKNIDVLIIEVYSGLSFVLADVASLVGRIVNLPIVLFLHGGSLPEFRDRFPRWTRRVLSRANSLIAPSPYLAEKISDGDAITVIPNIVSLDQYSYRHRQTVRPNLLWMRSFHDIYNPELAIKAFASVKERFPDSTLVMAGPDKGKLRDIVRLAKGLGVSDSVSFPGFLSGEQKARAFDQADVFLNTNRIDNMPVSVVEACAAGLPVVATDVGGLSKLLSDRKSGLLVKDDDPQALANAIVELIQNRPLAEELSRNGRSVAEASAWPNVLKRWQELFETTLGPASTNTIDRAGKEKLWEREA